MADAYCPACGGAIGVRGLLGIRTFRVCRHCGAHLSGRMVGRLGVLASEDRARADARAASRATRRQGRAEVKAGRADLDARLLDALQSGPVKVAVLAERFGVSKNDIRRAVVRQATRIRSKGHRSRETLSLR
jgi:hypothetical protein